MTSVGDSNSAMAEKDNASMKNDLIEKQAQQQHRHMVVVSGLGTAEAFTNGGADREARSNGHTDPARVNKASDELGMYTRYL